MRKIHSYAIKPLCGHNSTKIYFRQEKKRPFIYNILTMWGIRIVGTFICTQLLGLGLVSAWGCMVAHNLTLCALFLISFISGRWNPMNNPAKDSKNTENSY
jgi:Na+-driven multidrug efflux pump